MDRLPRHRPSPPLSRSGDSMEDPHVLCSPFNRIAPRRHSPQVASLSTPRNAISSNSSTPPISMPTTGSSSSGWQSNLLENTGPAAAADDDSRYMDKLLSPIEQAAGGIGGGRRRRNPITFDTFDPQVKLGGGRQMLLQEPLPKSYKNGCFSSMSDSERCSYESDFGGLGETLSRGDCGGGGGGGDGGGGGGDVVGSSRGGGGGLGRNGSCRDRRRVTAAQKFLLSPSLLSDCPDDMASLTSESTMSPMSEFHTPSNSFGSYNGRGGMIHSEETAYSLGTTSLPWHKLEENAGMPRNKTIFSEPSRSRSGSRQTRRRTFSERSMNSCSPGGYSPACMFLSSFGKHAPQKPVEPDAEGQEVGSYVLGKEIASGGFSVVKEAFTIEDDVEVKHAVKIVRKRVYDDDSDNDKIQASFDHEIELWRYLHHPNIMSLISVVDAPFATFAFMNLNRDGNLFDLMKRKENRQGLSAQRAQRYSFQIACALRYLHEDMRIVHGDVKLENCLLDLTNDAEEGGNILVCDFGLSKFIRNPDDDDDEGGCQPYDSPSQGGGGGDNRKPDCYSITGSLQYSAPEMIHPPTSEELRSPVVDIWAFAVTIFTLHTGMLPFNHTLQPKLAALILGGVWDVDGLRKCRGLVEAGKAQTEKVVQVVKGGLCTDYTRRWSIRDVLESTWFEGMAGSSSSESVLP